MSAAKGRARRKVIQEERVSTNIRIPRSIHERLISEAERREVSLTLITEKAIERYLPILEAQELWPE